MVLLKREGRMPFRSYAHGTRKRGPASSSSMCVSRCTVPRIKMRSMCHLSYASIKWFLRSCHHKPAVIRLLVGDQSDMIANLTKFQIITGLWDGLVTVRICMVLVEGIEPPTFGCRPNTLPFDQTSM